MILEPCSLSVVRDLCAQFHGYGSAGNVAVYSFAVILDDRPVAGFSWQPPPPGAAKSVSPEAPHGVLALSRMVAVPKTERRLRHISKPLRVQMKRLVDRTRWPVLVTFSDEGQGHTGHVYKCSGWQKTTRARVPVFTDVTGRRVSRYADGATNSRGFVRTAWTYIQRWEHWICARELVGKWLQSHGWLHEAIPGHRWRSGQQAYRWVRA